MSAPPLFSPHGSTHRKPSTGVAPRASEAKACTAACGAHRSESRRSQERSSGFALFSCPAAAAAAVMDVHRLARARREGGGEERQRHQARAPCLTDTLGKPRTNTCVSHAPRSVLCLHTPRSSMDASDEPRLRGVQCDLLLREHEPQAGITDRDRGRGRKKYPGSAWMVCLTDMLIGPAVASRQSRRGHKSLPYSQFYHCSHSTVNLTFSQSFD
jgi:hypothetical protein